MKRLITVAMVLGISITSSFAKKDFDNTIPFKDWKKSFAKKALAQGVKQTTLDKAFTHVRRNPKVIVYDRRQPEFSRTFGQYITSALSATRIKRAKEMYKKHKPMLDNISSKYGVDPHYLVAFWGLETNFGRHVGNMNVIRSLATLSHDTRRADFFGKELILALKIIQNGHADAKTFRGSWAGAFGQTQFMPSTFTAYAVDGDGDGRKDLWNSKIDIFSSSSNFLKKVGWKRNQHWGHEVKITSPDFDWSLTGHKIKKTVKQWAKLGITDINGNLLDESFLGKASLVIPAGANGPKFLVYTNFHKILVWNRSDYYGLAVGLLANKLIGKPDMRWSPRKGEKSLARKDFMTIQLFLKKKGYYDSAIDGVFGSGSKYALKQYQKSAGLLSDGYADEKILRHINGVK